MSNLRVLVPPVSSDLATGVLTGGPVSEDVRTIRDLKGVFFDENARSERSQDEVVYRVLSYQPVPQGTSGGLFFGTTFVSPGSVGEECFMTKGHFHAKAEASEYYWGVLGEGLLLLMDRDRSLKVEKVARGSVHFIPAFTAHRLVNTGAETLAVGACWPADAGHDYEAIARDGFGVRVLKGQVLREEGR
ncbi:MAG TPA: glucose-6-phosphate isomerase family protein [Fimbriimonas sp.]